MGYDLFPFSKQGLAVRILKLFNEAFIREVIVAVWVGKGGVLEVGC